MLSNLRRPKQLLGSVLRTQHRFIHQPSEFDAYDPLLNVNLPFRGSGLRFVKHIKENVRAGISNVPVEAIALGVEGEVSNGEITGEDVKDEFTGAGDEELQTHQPRPARKSPAAIFGEKQLPTIVLPSELQSKLQSVYNEFPTKLMKTEYQNLLPGPTPKLSAIEARGGSQKSEPKPVSKSLPPAEPHPVMKMEMMLYVPSSKLPVKSVPKEAPIETFVAHTAGWLPERYAVMRNVFRDVGKRMGWLDEEQGGLQFVDFNAGAGAGAWAAIATFPSPESNRNIYIQFDSEKSYQDLSIHLLKPSQDSPVTKWQNLFYRSQESFLKGLDNQIQMRKSVAVSGWQLLNKRRPQDRRKLIKEIWDSRTEYLVFVERGTPEGYQLIAETRQYLLELASEELKGHFISMPKYGKALKLREAREQRRLQLEGTLEQRLIASGEKIEDPRSAQARLLAGAKPKRRPPVALQQSEDEKLDFEELGPGVEVEEISWEEANTISAKELMDREMRMSQEVDSGEIMLDEEDERSLREMGIGSEKQEILDVKGRILGAHVLSPCPHDLKCPLQDTPSVCQFGQSYQRPFFNRQIKTAKRGDGQAYFSYVVFKRGPRNSAKVEEFRTGRVGEVGKEFLQKEEAKKSELLTQGENGVWEGEPDWKEKVNVEVEKTDVEQLRREASSWDRIITAPRTRKGHMVVTLCTSEGKIMRKNYPKSLGPQVWYDMKRSSWGDMIPHEAKGRAIEQTRGVKKLTPMSHSEISITISTTDPTKAEITGLGKGQKLTKHDFVALRNFAESLGLELVDAHTTRYWKMREDPSFNQPKNYEDLTANEPKYVGSPGPGAFKKSQEQIAAEGLEELLEMGLVLNNDGELVEKKGPVVVGTLEQALQRAQRKPRATKSFRPPLEPTMPGSIRKFSTSSNNYSIPASSDSFWKARLSPDVFNTSDDAGFGPTQPRPTPPKRTKHQRDLEKHFQREREIDQLEREMDEAPVRKGGSSRNKDTFLSQEDKEKIWGSQQQKSSTKYRHRASDDDVFEPMTMSIQSSRIPGHLFHIAPGFVHQSTPITDPEVAAELAALRTKVFVKSKIPFPEGPRTLEQDWKILKDWNRQAEENEILQPLEKAGGDFRKIKIRRSELGLTGWVGDRETFTKVRQRAIKQVRDRKVDQIKKTKAGFGLKNFDKE